MCSRSGCASVTQVLTLAKLQSLLNGANWEEHSSGLDVPDVNKVSDQHSFKGDGETKMSASNNHVYSDKSTETQDANRDESSGSKDEIRHCDT